MWIFSIILFSIRSFIPFSFLRQDQHTKLYYFYYYYWLVLGTNTKSIDLKCDKVLHALSHAFNQSFNFFFEIKMYNNEVCKFSIHFQSHSQTANTILIRSKLYKQWKTFDTYVYWIALTFLGILLSDPCNTISRYCSFIKCVTKQMRIETSNFDPMLYLQKKSNTIQFIRLNDESE